ncbi:hypothetical protein [Bosea sp. ASV33]|uniref:hypothetical protein n=1 Tax=Bosea sp. ASV33 TaxID=2795106 RepID=UPI0018EC7953|nr:hypothetical protein [Bosea sp. ASV33]
MAAEPKPPNRRKPKSEHFVQFRSKWIEGTATGYGIFVLPVLTGIIAIIVLNLAAIMWLG